MRNVYLVCYDVANDKRLRQMAKTLRGYGDRVQYSVFRCTLGDRERVELQGRCEDVMKPSEDRVLIVSLGPEGGRGGKALTALGKAMPEVEQLAYIV